MAEDKKTSHIAIIVMICCICVCLCSLAVFSIMTYQNNKKYALENATQRINELIEDIYEITTVSDPKYTFAKDKLAEIKT